jgi:Kef-type K+ transport system membrane component KefB
MRRVTSAQLALQLLFQIAVILAVCQAVGRVARSCGQPQVVAEMFAGVLLGPSLLGLVWPDLFAWLFPAESMRVLYPIAQLGLAAYMFVVGLEFRIDIVHKRLRSAMAVSVAGMAAPFILGAALGWLFHQQTSLFPDETTRTEAVIFMGASLCITAFPMLARIIDFKGLGGTTMGTVALGAGAINDAAAWCLLALVLASLDGDTSVAVITVVGGIGYVGLAMYVVRPLLHRWARGIEARGSLSEAEFTFLLVLLAAGAWFTDSIGLHAVFGAFVIGTVIPRGVISQSLIQRIQPLTIALLLPLFFTYSGLNTQIGLLNSAGLWLAAGFILFAAVMGKGGACWAAARATGLCHREALGIGTLMNTRGLMELIIINIGLQRGIISPALFATLVIMAVVTTLMTSPVFDWLTRGVPEADEPVTPPVGAIEPNSTE